MPGATDKRESGPELAKLRLEIAELVARNAVGMVQNAIDAVNEGQYQALKYLFEMIGLYPASAREDEPVDQSLAATLLHHLGVQDSPEQPSRGEKRTPVIP